MLILKLAIVPLFIAAVTLAGRRWGSRVAGLLGGFPVVTGPIVVFVALEQGQQFGALAALAAISGVAGLLAFGIAYSWASLRWPWYASLACGLIAWFSVAGLLAALPPLPQVALAAAGLSLLMTPWLLPNVVARPAASARLNDLPYRMITGALLTIGVTSAAASLGAVWSGLLASFPVIGSILGVFTHRAQGAAHTVQIYRGMTRGLYSFVAFFIVAALLWPNGNLWVVCIAAIAAGLAVQVVFRLLTLPRKSLQPTS